MLAGYTEGGLGGDNAGETDCAVVKLDADGGVLWRWQVQSAGPPCFACAGTPAPIHCLPCVPSRPDNTRHVGYALAPCGVKSSGTVASPNKNFRINRHGNPFGPRTSTPPPTAEYENPNPFLRTQQGGTAESDVCSAAVVAEDGSIVLAGYTVGSWDGSEANAGEEDLVVVKLDKDGNELWHWQVIAGSSTILDAPPPPGMLLYRGGFDTLLAGRKMWLFIQNYKRGYHSCLFFFCSAIRHFYLSGPLSVSA